MRELARDRIKEVIDVLNHVQEVCMEDLEKIVGCLISTFERDGKLLICGNGGSAADAQHLAAEFVSSFSFGLERKSLPAIALTVNSSVLTAVANDFNFDLAFSRQVEGLGVAGDALLVISTSGESANCLAAAETAKQLKMTTLALTRVDSTLYKKVDIAIGVPNQNTQHIQECHIVLYHCIAESVDNYFHGK